MSDQSDNFSLDKPELENSESPSQSAQNPGEANPVAPGENNPNLNYSTPQPGDFGLTRISLSQSQFNDINQLLADLQEKTKCPAIILTDHSGLAIAQDGTMDPSQLPTLAALSAADYAATSEMARIIGEENGFKMHYHEGPKMNVYVSGVIDKFILVIVFSKDTTFGMVKVLTNKAIVKFEEIFNRQNSQQEQIDAAQLQGTLNEDEFCDELTNRLDAALFGKPNDV